MVNFPKVNAKSSCDFYANFREFFRFFAQFSRLQNTLKYICNLNINRKTAHTAPRRPEHYRQFTRKFIMLPAFTLWKGAFAYNCTLKNKAGATQKMRPDAKNRVKERLSDRPDFILSAIRIGALPEAPPAAR